MAQPTTTSNAGGEEWRDLSANSTTYDPAAFASDYAAARERIGRIRQGDVVLKLTTPDGKPLAGRKVWIEQTRSHFPVGENLWGQDREGRDGRHDHDRNIYARQRFTEIYNAANVLCYWTERPRNDGPKSEDIQGRPQYDHFARLVDWGKAENLYVKGHPIFWSIPKAIPDWILRYPHETRLKFLEVRVRSMVARFGNKVDLWDAVNEPLWEAAWKHIETRHWPHLETMDNMVEYIAPVLRWAREEVPDSTYIVNDYGLDVDGGEAKAPKFRDGTPVTSKLQRRRFVELVAALKAAGAPPSAIGSQSHTGGWLSPSQQWQVYDELGRSGVPIHITEFWARREELGISDLPDDVQWQRFCDFIIGHLTIAYSHPSVEGYFHWGMFGQSVHFVNNDDSGHDLTPLYHRMRKLLRDEWMTKVEAVTDAAGVVRFRGFFGDYAVRHELSPGVKSGLRFRLEKGQAPERTLVLL